MIGQISLITDKSNGIFIATLAQAHNCLQAGLTSPDNNNTHYISVSLNGWVETNKLAKRIEEVIDPSAFSLQTMGKRGGHDE